LPVFKRFLNVAIGGDLPERSASAAGRSPCQAAAAQPANRNGDRGEIFTREKIFSMLKHFTVWFETPKLPLPSPA
jgi:hypothetical protein